MSGKCYACGSEFGFFKKEQGCKNCGFAFCSKCLTKKATVPKENLERWHKERSDKDTHHVCNKCYNILTGKVSGEQAQTQPALPEAYLKRMAALEQKEAGGASHGSQHTGGAAKVNPKYAALDKPDRQIAERLEKLKEKPKGKEVKTSDKDLNERLARLKGEDPSVRTAPSKPFYQAPDRRSEVEQIDDLLDEIASEVDIDSHHPTPAVDVENRLSKLQGKQTGKGESNNLDTNNLSPQKNFVKNIDVGTGPSAHASGGGQKEEGDDFLEVQALMARAASEMEADAHRALEDMKGDKQLMERLAAVKQRTKDKDGRSEDSNVDNTQQDDDDSEDEETAAKRLMTQFLAEAQLDERAGADLTAGGSDSGSAGSTVKSKRKERKESNVDADAEYEDPDELPYCIICTEDAVTRCIDCDMDLYCNRCFRDGHKELGLSDHRTKPYKAPKGYSN